MYELTDIPLFTRARASQMHAIFIRDWWSGRKFDFIGVWEEGGKTRLSCFEYPARDSGQQPLPSRNDISNVAEVGKLVSTIDSLGGFSLQSQEQPLIMTHFDDHFFFNGAGRCNEIRIACGRHAIEEAGLILDMFLDLREHGFNRPRVL